MITRTEERFRSSMYQKLTFTWQYLNFNTQHPYNVKKCIVCCLQPWAKAISSDSYVYQKEIKSLRDNLHRKNYSKIPSKKSRSNNRKRNLKTHHNMSALCQGAIRKNSKAMQSILGQYSPVARLFENISAEASQQQNTTRLRIACTPSHAVVVEYIKAKHAAR